MYKSDIVVVVDEVCFTLMFEYLNKYKGRPNHIQRKYKNVANIN